MSIKYNSIIPTGSGGSGTWNGGTVTNEIIADGGITTTDLTVTGTLNADLGKISTTGVIAIDGQLGSLSLTDSARINLFWTSQQFPDDFARLGIDELILQSTSQTGTPHRSYISVKTVDGVYGEEYPDNNFQRNTFNLKSNYLKLVNTQNEYVELSTDGLRFADGTVQTTAGGGSGLPLTGGTLTGNLIIDAGAGSAGHYETTEMFVTRTDANTGEGESNAYGALYNGGVEVGDIAGNWAELTPSHLRFGDGTIQTTAQIPVFTNQIVTNSRLENTKTFPHEIALAETDAGIIYSSSKQFRDFEQYDGTDYGVKNYTLSGFGLQNFHINGCPNVRTINLTNMPNLCNVKVVGTGTIENINLDGSEQVTYLNLSGLTFSSTNFSDMVSNFVMRNQENTLFLTNLNLAGAIPSTWYNNLTKTLGIDGVAVDDLSFITPTTFPWLRWLRIADNVPASLPSIKFASFTHLENLYARGRGVDGIETFSLPTSIKAVDLSNSNFYDFEASMSNLTLPNLISINFSNCNLYSAEFIPINEGVKYLNLEGNDFSGDYGAGLTSLITLLDAIDALNESGLISTDKHKELNFTGSNMPVFTSTPTSVTNLRSRGYYVYGNGL